MKFIELHFRGSKYCLNADYIVAVNPKESGEGCDVYMVSDRINEAWNTDESYEEILRMLKEVK